VPDDDRQIGVRVERPGDGEAQHVHAGLGVPAPARRRERGAGTLGQAPEVDVGDGGWRRRGVEVEGHAELRAGGEHGGELGVVEEAPVGLAEHHGADEARLTDGAEAVGVLGHGGREPVVGGAGQGDARRAPPWPRLRPAACRDGAARACR
jgi:hypothetical protein